MLPPPEAEAAASGAGGNDSRPRGGRGQGGGRGRGGQNNPRGSGQRRGGRGSGRGQGQTQGQGRGASINATAQTFVPTGTAEDGTSAHAGAQSDAAKGKRVDAPKNSTDEEGEEDDDAEVCFICANPVAHHSIAPCNHKTCHICGLRMRALYKTKDCAHCRTPAPFVIFTDDAEKRFEDYSEGDFSTSDTNIGIKYTNEDIVGDTVLLLRYNCPDASCDFAGLGWPDLHRHVKSVHKKRMCDLCTRNKKVFTHEHELFTDRELEKHMRRGDDKPGAADQTGFKGHPLCGFCGERFYDDDKLYDHCRMKHERCFICDRRDSRTPHYFLNYDELEKHFQKDHFLCSDRGCMEKKFVVFESDLDMQAHQLAEHGGKSASRDARLVNISNFDIRQSYQQERQGEGRSRGRGGRGARGRDPNEDAAPTLTSSTPHSLRRDELAFQRQMAIHSAPAGSSRTFRGQLSAPATPAPAPTGSGPFPTPAASSSRNPTSNQNRAGASSSARTSPNRQAAVHSADTSATNDVSNLSPEERARLVRHGSVIERAANLLGNDAHKIANFRNHVSSYRQGVFTAPQLVEAFFTLFADVSSNALGTLVREVADLFEERNKADNLRKAWQDWRAINEDYPSLPNLSGMHGETSSSTGWANAVVTHQTAQAAAPSQKHSTRVLKLKNSTRLGGPAPTPSRTVPGWVASSTGGKKSKSQSSAAFPALPVSSTTASGSSSSAAASSLPSWIGPISQPNTQTRAAPPPPRSTGRSGQDNFPSLPAAPKPMTTIFGYGNGRGVRRDYGQQESNFQWGAAPAASSSDAPENAEDGAETTGKGKKGGKKVKKQVLVQWG